MELNINRVGATSIIAVAGDVDADTGYELYLAAIGEADAGSSQVVLNLADVHFVDSVGLGMLIRSRDELADHHEATVTLHDPSPRIVTLLELTATTGQFVITRDGAQPPRTQDDADLQRGKHLPDGPPRDRYGPTADLGDD